MIKLEDLLTFLLSLKAEKGPEQYLYAQWPMYKQCNC